MTDEQPTPPPLDLDAIEARVKEVQDAKTLLAWEVAASRIAEFDTPNLVAEVRRLRADLAAARAALAGLVGCIDESAADRGPPITQGSMMAQVCNVLQRTTQYDYARAALGDRP